MTIELVPTALDHPGARRMLEAFAAWAAETYPGWTSTVGPSAHPEEFVPPRGLFVVAYREDGELVGCGGLKRLDASTGEVKRLYVMPDERKRGVASRIMNALEAAASQAGYTRVRLDTGNRQPAAVRLFESNGYERISDYNGNPFASYWYEKLLG
jgi:GNAT superfamily N-acetyltransferase